MKSADFPIMTANLGENDLKFFERGIALYNDAIENGGVLKGHFNDIKSYFNRSVERTWQATVSEACLRVFHSGERDRPENQVFNDLYWISKPAMHTIAGTRKKIEKIFKTKPIEAAAMALKLLDEIEPLGEATEKLKGMIKTRVTKTAEERKQEAFTPPPSNAKAVAKVRAILEKIVDEQFENLVTSGVKHQMDRLDDFMAKQQQWQDGEIKLKRGSRSFGPYEYAMDRNGRSNPNIRGLIEPLVEQPSYKEPYQRKKNANEIIRKIATKQAEDIRDGFVAKNLLKLTSILEAKGDDKFGGVEEIGRSIHMASLEGMMSFTFKDGSSFTTSNSVVFVVNEYGTQFYRFPLTFHDVVLPDGSKMKSPSEKRMNTVWAVA